MTGLRKRSGGSSNKHVSVDGESEGDSGFVTPDSTTSTGDDTTAPAKRTHRNFQDDVGEEVLSHGKDGRFYLGTIVEVDEREQQCLVQFTDNTAHWSLFKDLRSLKPPKPEDCCVLCKSTKSTTNNEIVFCNSCQQGCHQQCAIPRITSKAGSGKPYTCSHCANTTKPDSPLPSTNISKPRYRTYCDDMDNKLRLPYDLKSLHWDAGHKMNREQTYCYCGGPGEWYNRMLQCKRCLQWFHEACIDSLHYNLLYGDRFYVFVCNCCNENFGEFVHRMELSWVDVVHLALFSLTLGDGKAYFDYETSITHWIDNNWELLQAPLELQSVCVEDRAEEVIHVLESNKSRFKCGREMRKRPCVWALRCRVPPPVPFISLPLGAVTDENVTQLRPAHRSSNPHCSPPLPRTVRVKNDKTDANSNHTSHYSPVKKRALLVPVPPASSFIHHHIESNDRVTSSHLYSPPVASSIDSQGKNASQNNNCNDEDTVKIPALSPNNTKKRKRKGELDKLIQDEGTQKALRDVSHDLARFDMLGDATNCPSAGWRRRGRPPKGTFPIIPNNTTSHEVSLKGILSAQTRHSFSSYSSSSSLADDSSDDTSSRGTLDAFIPPLSNFEGHNNPFLNMFSASSTWLNSNGATAPSKPYKKKLSESDIRISKTGEIKRRRFRRKRSARDVLESSTSISEFNEGVNATRNAEDVPPSGSLQNCVDYALSARFTSSNAAQKDQDKSNFQKGGVVSDSVVSFDDLKSSVNNYFGAANRIANGEKFHVLAKRVCCESGKVEYLIEWDVLSS